MRVLETYELAQISGGVHSNWDYSGQTPGQRAEEEVNANIVTNTFKILGGGTVTVSGPDSNNDGVVDDYTDLANDQRDINCINNNGLVCIKPGSVVDEFLDAVTEQPYSYPDDS